MHKLKYIIDIQESCRYILFYNNKPLFSPVFNINGKYQVTPIPLICYNFYPTALKGCRGIVFTHGVRMGRSGGGTKFVRAVRCRKLKHGKDIG